MESNAQPLLSKLTNIYLVGAQCTGKTTLVKALLKHFEKHDNCRWQGQQIQKPRVIIEVARGVMQKHGLNAEDVTSLKGRGIEMQKLILEAQLQAEFESDGWFISDRSGFDPIVYARRYVGDDAAQELMASNAFAVLQKNMQQSLMIVCEAGADWLFDDGVRLMPTSRDDWVDFHKLFCASLDSIGMSYVVLPYSITRPEERVDFVLERWAKDNAQQDSIL